MRNAPGAFDTKLFAFVISLDKSSEEADSTKEEAAKMEKEYEVSKDSTKNEGQNAAGNSEESGGTEYCFPTMCVPNDWSLFLSLALIFHGVSINIFSL